MMVRPARRNFLSAIYLFNDHQPNQLMGEHQIRQRPDGIGSRSQLVIDAVGPTDDQGGVPAGVEKLLQVAGQLRGGEVLTAFVQKDDVILWTKMFLNGRRLFLTGALFSGVRVRDEYEIGVVGFLESFDKAFDAGRDPVFVPLTYTNDSYRQDIDPQTLKHCL